MKQKSMNMVVGCSSCSHDSCPLSDPECAECAEGNRVLSGWKFSAVCALVFVLPIALAIVGSMSLATSKMMGLFGGIVGFLLGWMISTSITRFCAIEK